MPSIDPVSVMFQILQLAAMALAVLEVSMSVRSLLISRTGRNAR